MNEISVNGGIYTVDRAARGDLPALIDLLRDDPLGAERESTDLSAYERAFTAIDDDPRQHLASVRDSEGNIVGTMQMTLIPGLARSGALRLQIEGVRVAEHARGGGLGRAMFSWAHEFGRGRGAELVQLTTDKTRTGAHRFYENLGYEATHEGFKRAL